MASYLDDQSRPQINFETPPSHSAPNSNGLYASQAAEGDSNGDGSYVPRPKRIACAVCRRRKLKCDGRRPSCGTCSRLGHECTYDEARKKSGPKRGYVKQLEARLGELGLAGTDGHGVDANAALNSSPGRDEVENP